MSDLAISNLSRQEMYEISGGTPWVIPFLTGVVVGGLVGELIRDGVKQCFKDLEEGYNSIDDKN